MVLGTEMRIGLFDRLKSFALKTSCADPLCALDGGLFRCGRFSRILSMVPIGTSGFMDLTFTLSRHFGRRHFFFEAHLSSDAEDKSTVNTAGGIGSA